MSNWYVRRCRDRFWAKGMEQDKINAYMTLYTALVNVCKCAAPMIPFMTEEIYQNIVRSVDPAAPESIHLCLFPEADETHIDKELEESMDEVLRIVVMGRACRNASNIKNRQPIAQMFVKAAKGLDAFYQDIIKNELNVKKVNFTDDVSASLQVIPSSLSFALSDLSTASSWAASGSTWPRWTETQRWTTSRQRALSASM